MKKIFFILSLCFLSQSLFATQININNKSLPILIELGQDYPLKTKVLKIWIENSKIISAQNQNALLVLKGLLVGQTLIRINNESQKVIVVPIGSLKTFSDWQVFSKKYLDLKTDLCGEVICLKGKIYRYSDYEKILEQMKKESSTIFFATQLSENLKSKINSSLETFMRFKGLTPLKINFTEPWRIQFTNKDLASEYKNSLQEVGILALENKQKLEIADNIKVSVQIAEIKKDFGRSIGLNWPGSYSAQLINAESISYADLTATLNAAENDGQAKILASPNLICRSGKEAEFFAGGEFPIKIINFKLNDVIWKKYGVNLKIKPQIDSSGQMSIQIDSEVSSLDMAHAVEGIPGIHSHKVSSYFDLIKSQTIALSGLIMHEEGNNSDGLPWLKQIPILGLLFSSQNFKESKSELTIFVTPELMKQETGY